MNPSHLQVTWDSYENNICRGLSRLQQNEEFVDMSLAADGYLVKVHQNIVALSSPYIRAMLKSAACQHPVIFLNNVSYEVLSYILEYIYMGKVQVPMDKLDSFVTASKALSIEGLHNMSQCIPIATAQNQTSRQISVTETAPESTQSTNNFAALITISDQNFDLKIQKTNIGPSEENSNTNGNIQSEYVDEEYLSESIDFNMYDVSSLPIVISEKVENPSSLNCKSKKTRLTIENRGKSNSDQTGAMKKNGKSNQSEDEKFYSDQTDTIKTNGISNQSEKSNSDQTGAIEMNGKSNQNEIVCEPKALYTISNRGALQMIVNNYMYSCHHQAYGGFKKRWRCLEYRKKRCPAVIDTEGEVITNRSGVHRHPSHKQKMLKKSETNLVFSSLIKADAAAILQSKSTFGIYSAMNDSELST